MRWPLRKLGAVLPVLLLLSSASLACASSMLLRVKRLQVSAPAAVVTYSGPVEFSSAAVKPATALTVVWMLDTFDAAGLERAQASLMTLYGQIHGRPLRLAVLRGSELTISGPFASRARLEEAVAEMALKNNSAAPNAPLVSADPAVALGPLDALNANAAQLGSRWSPVLLMGKLPRLDATSSAYAQALLLRGFATQQLRVSLLAWPGEDDSWAPLFRSTGGDVVHEAGDVGGQLEENGEAFLQVAWSPAKAPRGFVVAAAEIRDAQGAAIANVPDIADSGAALPTVQAYTAQQKQLTEALGLLQQPESATAMQKVRGILVSAQSVNPMDPQLLRGEMLFCESSRAFTEAEKAAYLLTQVRPSDPDAFAALGHAEALAAEWDKAEAALNRAASLKAPASRLAEDYAKIHLGRGDERGALPYLNAALIADSKRQDLWFLQARTAEHLPDPKLAIDSLERGLALGGFHNPESRALIRLYLANGNAAKAHAYARRANESLPADAASRAEFALTLEDLKLPEEALVAWKSALTLQPELEPGHVHVARLLLNTGQMQAAQGEVEASLRMLPRSAGLFSVEADAAQQQGRGYEVRRILAEGASSTKDTSMLERFAAVQESFGEGAAEAYANAAAAQPAASPERLQLLEQGMLVALRDGDLKRAEEFAAKLKTEGHAEFGALLGSGQKIAYDGVIPGGMEALAFVAGSKKNASPEQFFAEYARALVAHTCAVNCHADEYVKGVQKFFTEVTELETYGKRDGNRVVITLSMDGREKQKETEKVLAVLGLQIHTKNGVVKLDRSEKEGRAERQETASALALDEIGLQEALQAGKPFDFEIVDEPVAVYPSAKLWNDAFGAGAPGAFAALLLHSPELAKLYLATAAMDRHALDALLGAISLPDLAARSTDALAMYGTAFALQGSHASVPGGTAAEPLWQEMAGSSPANAGAFFRSLLEPNNSNVLGFFYTISQLDPKHQAFVTASVGRAKRFYKLFASSVQSQAVHLGKMRDSSLADMLRSVPLDDNGHILFPGSPEIWSLAKGLDANQNLLPIGSGNSSRTIAPDREDEVLLHMAETHSTGQERSLLDDFLAVVRVEMHRTQPLDAQSAFLLAHHAGEFWPLYPYFSDLPAIDYAGFQSFFDLIARIRQLPLLEQNLELGQMYALLKWTSLLSQRHMLKEAEVSRLFTLTVNRLAAATDSGAVSAASMDLAAEILKSCGHGAPGKLDEDLRICLVGGGEDAESPRMVDYSRVLEAQQAPSLDLLHSVTAYARGILKNSSNDAGAAKFSASDLVKAVAELPSVPSPKQATVSGRERDAILLYDPAEAQKLAAELSRSVSEQKGNSQKLAAELLKALEPQVTVALAAPVYAYYLRSTDLVVDQDPLLVRKHRYFDFTAPAEQRPLIVEADFVSSSDGMGSYLEGGFAQFALAAGRAAAVGWRQGGRGGDAVIPAQLAALRSSLWDQLQESDQRIVSLRILTAREWIVAAAQSPAKLQALSEETPGVLSLSRRAKLLSGIEDRDWPQVWASATLPDLLVLGSIYEKRYPNETDATPARAELHRLEASNDGSRLDILGRIPYQVLGCMHTHLIADAPYEEYARRFWSEDMAERAADFKLFLAYRADSMGVEPADTARVAETLAKKAFRSSQMSDYHDWRSLLAAYDSITSSDVERALQP